MKITTQRQLIRSVAKRWRQQYGLIHDNSSSCGDDKKQIAEKLDALDKETATVSDVSAIIGNESWTRLKCNECGKDAKAVLTVGEKPYYESHTASLCQECAEKVAAICWE